MPTPTPTPRPLNVRFGVVALVLALGVTVSLGLARKTWGQPKGPQAFAPDDMERLAISGWLADQAQLERKKERLIAVARARLHVPPSAAYFGYEPKTVPPVEPGAPTPEPGAWIVLLEAPPAPISSAVTGVAPISTNAPNDPPGRS